MAATNHTRLRTSRSTARKTSTDTRRGPAGPAGPADRSAAHGSSRKTDPPVSAAHRTPAKRRSSDNNRPVARAPREAADPGSAPVRRFSDTPPITIPRSPAVWPTASSTSSTPPSSPSGRLHRAVLPTTFPQSQAPPATPPSSGEMPCAAPRGTSTASSISANRTQSGGAARVNDPSEKAPPAGRDHERAGARLPHPRHPGGCAAALLERRC
jgi:hypothetical protein